MTQGERWSCGHPRTPENTNHRQCRTCKTAQQRERYASDPAFAEHERERARAQHDKRTGVAYSLWLLRNRRSQAMRRRRQREQEVK